MILGKTRVTPIPRLSYRAEAVIDLLSNYLVEKEPWVDMVGQVSDPNTAEAEQSGERGQPGLHETFPKIHHIPKTYPT